MIRFISRYSGILLAIVAMSYAFPVGFDKVFVQEIGSPLLFFSPLQKQFIYRESLGGHRFNYMNESGASYNRIDFESLLPFLYYKTLEKKNALPVHIDGRVFSKKAIKIGRQGLGIKSRHLNNHHPQIQLYPLFSNNPQVAVIPFPEDVFRFTDTAMEFINADSNRIDVPLTERFTSVLNTLGFVFPATVIGGKTTNLKPFDEGFFVRDSDGQVFHIKRVLDQPVIVKTPIDPKLDIQDIIVSENRRKEFYGIIITRQGGLHLISYDNYRLIPLPVELYEPDRMDFTLLINPLYTTVVSSQAKTVSATAMDRNYLSFRTFELERYNPTSSLVQVSRDLLFPFQICFDNPYRGQADLRLQFGGVWALLGILLALIVFLLTARKKQPLSIRKGDFFLVLFTGFFGLIAISCLTRDESF